MAPRTLLLFLLIIGGLLGVCQGVSAEVYNGNCGANGNNVTWSLNTSTGVMTLSGSGAMKDWDNTTTPWNSYLSSIQTVNVGSGITRIGNQAFCNCNNLTSVTFSGTTVTSIGQFAFRPCSSLTSITFPSSLTSIEWAAFQVSGLMIVDLPSSFTSLGSGAFFGSTNLKYVIIPSSVTTIKNQAFENCSSLEEIHVKWTTTSAIPAWPSYFTNKTSSSIKLYVPCGKSSLYSAKDGWKNYTIVEETASGVCGSHLIWSLSCDGVLTIRGTGAMADWSNSSRAPWYNSRSSITSVVIDDGVTSIGSWAFYNCKALTSITIPNSVTTIGNYAFNNCSKLASVTLPNNLTTINDGVLSNCSALTNITIPDGVTTIGFSAFGSCTSLTSVTIPNSVNSFGNQVLYGCLALKDIYVSWPSSIPGWPTNFTNKSPQSSITLHVPCGTKSLYQAANGWKDYTLTETTIGGNCGASGNNLTWSFCIGTGTLTITGSGAMKDWSSAEEVPWNNYRSSITSVVLPVGLTSIGGYAFSGCDITKIDLPAAIRTLGKHSLVSSLRELYIPEGVTALPDELLHPGVGYVSKTTPIKRLYLPSTLTTIGTASIGFHNLNILTYPASVTNVGRSSYFCGRGPVNKDLYASWPADQVVTLTTGVIYSRCPGSIKMHIPYGTTAAYAAKGWNSSYTLVEDVDERAIDLGLSIRWASCNVGATAPEQNGTYFAWGDTIGRSAYTWTTYSYSGTALNTLTKYNTRTASGTIDNRTTLIAFDDAAYINWGETWRMPTWTEWNELITQCTWEETTVNSVAVWKVIGPNGNFIYLPKGGFKNNTSTVAGCYYWSSSLSTVTSNDGCNRALYVNAADRSGAKYGLRYVGMPVRAVYRREWPSFTLTICDTTDGSTYTKAINAAATYTLTAKEDACHQFVRWSDGNTNKTRTVTVTANASYTAEYETRHGTCGATGNEANVTWTLSCDSILTISGTGAMADWNFAPWSSNRLAIKTVVINSGVTNIGNNAFANCENLQSVTIPESVTTIGVNAFYRCFKLKFITIPQSVISLGLFALNSCNALTDIYVSWTNSIPNRPMNFTSTSSITLHVPCGTKSTYQAAAGWKDYAITDDVTLSYSGTCGAAGHESDVTWLLNRCDSTLTISGTGAMYNWYPHTDRPWYDYLASIKQVIIEEGVTTTGFHAFYGCSNLTSVSLPSTLTTLEFMTFYGCSQLTSLTIPASVTGIGNRALEGCSALTDVYVSWTENIPAMPAGIHAYEATQIKLHIPCGTTDAYTDKSWNTKFTLDDGSASGTCGATGSNLTWSLSCDSVLAISGTGEMRNWSSSVYTPWDAYRGKIKHIVIEDGVTSIGKNAFSNLLNVTSLSIGSDVTSIGENAFYHCPLLEQVVIPDNVQTIGKQAFCNCSGVTTLTLGTGMTTIGQFAFAGCASLTSITIPDNVQTLSKYAFTGCTNVTTITIGTGVNTVEDYIFASMPNITDMYVGWTTADAIPAWSTGFTQVSPQSDITLHVPCSAMELYRATDGWKDYTVEGEGSYTITVTTDDASMGSVAITVP